MPLNDSGVRGQAVLFLEGNELTVRVIATGLEPNMPHPQHIHGFMATEIQYIRLNRPTPMRMT